MTTERRTTRSEQETEAAGRDLAERLSPGAVVLLFGDLGAGKTAFVRGLAEGLGIAQGDVTSPTFTIMQEYRGPRVTLFHVDLYRLNDPREVEDLGLDEIAADGILAIEWAEKLRTAPPGAVRVTLAHVDEDERGITIENAFPNYSDR